LNPQVAIEYAGPKNIGQTCRIAWLSRNAARIHSQSGLKEVLPRPVRDVARSVFHFVNRGLNRRSFRPPPLSSEVAAGLEAVFGPMVADLEVMLGRSLAIWKQSWPGAVKR